VAWVITVGALYVLVIGLLTVMIASAAPSSTSSDHAGTGVPDRGGVHRPAGVVLFLAGSRLLRAGALADDAAGRRIR
jgi:hypothetical protein